MLETAFNSGHGDSNSNDAVSAVSSPSVTKGFKLTKRTSQISVAGIVMITLLIVSVIIGGGNRDGGTGAGITGRTPGDTVGDGFLATPKTTSSPSSYPTTSSRPTIAFRPTQIYAPSLVVLKTSSPSPNAQTILATIEPTIRLGAPRT